MPLLPQQKSRNSCRRDGARDRKVSANSWDLAISWRTSVTSLYCGKAERSVSVLSFPLVSYCDGFSNDAAETAAFSPAETAPCMLMVSVFFVMCTSLNEIMRRGSGAADAGLPEPMKQ